MMHAGCTRRAHAIGCGSPAPCAAPTPLPPTPRNPRPPARVQEEVAAEVTRRGTVPADAAKSITRYSFEREVCAYVYRYDPGPVVLRVAADAVRARAWAGRLRP